MSALTLARQRIRERMQSPSVPQPVRLAHGLVDQGRAGFLPILSSSLAQEILTRGYDARTLDHVYANRAPLGAGLVGRMADRVVLDMPLHQGLRERLEAAVGEICAAASLAVRRGEPEFRFLSAPCGLGAELAGVAERLRRSRAELFPMLRAWGVDPDPEGALLPEARRRVRSTGLNAAFIREDLRRHREVAAVAAEQGPFHLISCLGYSQDRPLEDLAALLRFDAGLLASGGTLLVDRWEPSDPSKRAAGLGVHVQCYPVRDFQHALRAAGLRVEREHPTGEGGCVLVVARKA
jgi:hypothetical protein